jgi:hypothetical protein
MTDTLEALGQDMEEDAADGSVWAFVGLRFFNGCTSSIDAASNFFRGRFSFSVFYNRAAPSDARPRSLRFTGSRQKVLGNLMGYCGIAINFGWL